MLKRSQTFLQAFMLMYNKLSKQILFFLNLNRFIFASSFFRNLIQDIITQLHLLYNFDTGNCVCIQLLCHSAVVILYLHFFCLYAIKMSKVTVKSIQKHFPSVYIYLNTFMNSIQFTQSQDTNMHEPSWTRFGYKYFLVLRN